MDNSVACPCCVLLWQDIGAVFDGIMGGKPSTSGRGRTYSNAGEACSGGSGLTVHGQGASTSGGSHHHHHHHATSSSHARHRARSLGSVQNGAHGHSLSIPSSNGGATGAGSPDSDASTPDDSPFPRGFLHPSSLPVHLFSFNGKDFSILMYNTR